MPLLTHIKEAPWGLVEEVKQREELGDKLGGRMLTLGHCMDHKHEELHELIKELRKDFQVGLETIKQCASEEAEALLMPLRDQATNTQANMYLMADNAHRATEAAFRKCMEQLPATRHNDSADGSEWCFLDNEQFQ